MKKCIKVVFWSLLAMLATQLPVDARRLPKQQDAAQLRRGLAAFNRQDYTPAGLLLWRPAESGDARAQAVLCFLHTYGRGVPQNFQAAAYWCHRSAEQDNAQGQYLLGLLYDKGHGVPKNFVQAYKWLNLAAAHASGPKRDFFYRIRDAVATKMSPHQVAKAQALAIAWRPVFEVQGPAFIARQCAAGERCLDP